jgi:hypothetical protein
MAIESVVLKKGEEIREFYSDAHVIAMPMLPPSRDGSLALTSKRVLWITKLGKSSRISLDFPLENVKGITINYGWHHKTLTIEGDKASYAFVLNGKDEHRDECFHGLVWGLVNAKQKSLVKKSRRNVHGR